MAVSGVLISFISFFAAKIFFNATSVEAKQTACILGIIFIAFMLIAGTRTIIITYPPDDLDE